MRLAQILKFDRTSLPALVRIAGFILIAVLPLVVWATLGTVKPYGREHTRFPRIGALLEGRAFNVLGQAVLDRSSATRTVVQLKVPFDYRLGTVDTKAIISGKGDWLFFKGEFWDGECLSADELRALLARADVLAGMAKAAGIETVISVSPDSSSLNPEQLLPIYRRYWRCKSESADLWRKIAQEEAPDLIDHRAVLLAAKQSGTHKLYFHRDTHWTPYGAALSFRQTLKVLFPDADIDGAPLKTVGMAATYPGNSSMLLLPDDRESYELVEDGIAAAIRDEKRTAILHDSFYLYLLKVRGVVLGTNLKDVFPNSVDLGYHDKLETITAGLDGAARLIINTVEREVPRRLSVGTLSPKGALTQALLARNALAAAECSGFRTTEGSMGERSSISDGRAVETVTVQVPELGQGTAACLKVTLKDWKAKPLKIFLPKRGARQAPFARGRSIVYTPGADGVVALVLPSGTEGNPIRLEAAPGASFAKIEIGERPSALPIASAAH